jgi:hypothetical protein
MRLPTASVRSCARTTHGPELPMLTQKKIDGPKTLLKLYVAIDEDLKTLRPQFAGQTAAP